MIPSTEYAYPEIVLLGKASTVTKQTRLIRGREITESRQPQADSDTVGGKADITGLTGVDMAQDVEAAIVYEQEGVFPVSGVVVWRLELDWLRPRAFRVLSGADGPCAYEEERAVFVTD